MSIDNAIDRIRMYFNLDLKDRDKEKLRNIISEVQPVKIVNTIVKNVVKVEKPETPKPVKLDELLEEVCERHSIKRYLFMSKNRKRELVDARKEFLKIARNEYGVSLKTLARFMNVHHTTIMHHTDERFQYKKLLSLKKTYQNDKSIGIR